MLNCSGAKLSFIHITVAFDLQVKAGLNRNPSFVKKKTKNKSVGAKNYHVFTKNKQQSGLGERARLCEMIQAEPDDGILPSSRADLAFTSRHRCVADCTQWCNAGNRLRRLLPMIYPRACSLSSFLIFFKFCFHMFVSLLSVFPSAFQRVSSRLWSEPSCLLLARRDPQVVQQTHVLAAATFG